MQTLSVLSYVSGLASVVAAVLAIVSVIHTFIINGRARTYQLIRVVDNAMAGGAMRNALPWCMNLNEVRRAALKEANCAGVAGRLLIVLGLLSVDLLNHISSLAGTWAVVVFALAVCGSACYVSNLYWKSHTNVISLLASLHLPKNVHKHFRYVFAEQDVDNKVSFKHAINQVGGARWLTINDVEPGNFYLVSHRTADGGIVSRVYMPSHVELVDGGFEIVMVRRDGTGIYKSPRLHEDDCVVFGPITSKDVPSETIWDYELSTMESTRRFAEELMAAVRKKAN